MPLDATLSQGNCSQSDDTKMAGYTHWTNWSESDSYRNPDKEKKDIDCSFPLLALQHMMEYLSVAGVSACTMASPTWRASITHSMATSAVLRDFGQEFGTWLGRLSPPQRLAAVRCLARAPFDEPERYVCPVVPVQSTAAETMMGGASSSSSLGQLKLHREGHTVVCLPRILWPKATDVLGKLIVFGGSEGASSTIENSGVCLTVRGGLKGVGTCELRATGEKLHVDSDEPAPVSRLGHGAIWLQDVCSMVVFGGRRGDHSQPNLGDLWLLEHRDPLSHMFEWNWSEVKPSPQPSSAIDESANQERAATHAASSSTAVVPDARCHFAICELSGRSFFLHGGHSSDGVLGDSWVCWIDDGFADLDEFDDLDAPQGSIMSRQASSVALSRQESEKLIKQVSDSYKKISPQVSASSNVSCNWAPKSPVPTMMEDQPVGPVAVWSRVVADGRQPPPCCGHAAVRCGDSVIISGGWSGRTISSSLSPVFVLQGLANPQTAPDHHRRRPVFTEVVLPHNSVCRPFGTLHYIGGQQTVAVGGWDDGNSDSKDYFKASDSVRRPWHAACKLSMTAGCGPLIAVHGGQDESGSTRDDLLLLHWPIA